MIRKFLKRLIKKIRGKSADNKIIWPTSEQIQLLPWFDGFDLAQISVIDSEESAQQAYEALLLEKVVGFDTESKPTFVKGEKSTGPHVVQFSTMKRAYVFILHDHDARKVAGKLIALTSLKKVGFGLNDDIKRIIEKLKVTPHNVVDVETVFAAQGYGRGVGVKVGVAIAFKRRFRKSKKASTSNWASVPLSERQVLYAANDAYAAIKVFAALS